AFIAALIVFVLRPLLSTSKQPPAAAAPAPLSAPARAGALPAPAAGDPAAATATALRRAADIVRSNTDESAGVLKDWIRKAS
ncbi:MAG TPA: hypothetical protein DEA50_14835, partial [Parvularcula sp.]|nr:hypothetical protein [Parvularcula sp.]